MDYAVIVGLALAAITIFVVLWDFASDDDSSAAETLKSLRG